MRLEMLFQSDPLLDGRLKRLAKEIESLAEKDEIDLRRTRDVYALRRRAALEIHAVCAGFVEAVNRLLPRPELELDPGQYREEQFHETLPNLIQINVRGRILQAEFEATPELVSTEDFRVPYTLSGAVRAFNQALLDKDLIEEQLIFYTVEKDKSMWRFFDPRTYRSGALDQEYLVTLMEQLL
jgi:hypothetical protein